MIGISIRFALAVGLHLRNENPSADRAKKEGLARTWWCLHSIECLVSSITGRPPIIAEEQCTIPLPQNHLKNNSRDSSASGRATRIRRDCSSPHAPAGSSTSDSDRRTADEDQFLLAYIGVTRISQKVLYTLYSPRTAAESWVVRTFSKSFAPNSTANICVPVNVFQKHEQYLYIIRSIRLIPAL